MNVTDTACAHLVVRFKPILQGDGSFLDAWRCDACKGFFLLWKRFNTAPPTPTQQDAWITQKALEEDGTRVDAGRMDADVNPSLLNAPPLPYSMLCSMCGGETIYQCAWCLVYGKVKVPLCGEVVCRERHEAGEKGCVRTGKDGTE